MSNHVKAVFIDRDGVLNTTLPPYISRWQDYVWYPWTFAALRRLRQAGAFLFLITNQSGIGRGYFSESQLLDIHNRLQDRLDNAGIKVAELYYCPHRPEEDCACRKPKPGMLQQAVNAYDVDLSKAFLVGDHYTDIEAGNAVGASTILVESLRNAGNGEMRVAPDYRATTLLNAANIIINQWERS